jgi:hypothetical protein
MIGNRILTQRAQRGAEKPRGRESHSKDEHRTSNIQAFPGGQPTSNQDKERKWERRHLVPAAGRGYIRQVQSGQVHG